MQIISLNQNRSDIKLKAITIPNSFELRFLTKITLTYFPYLILSIHLR